MRGRWGTPTLCSRVSVSVSVSENESKGNLYAGQVCGRMMSFGTQREDLTERFIKVYFCPSLFGPKDLVRPDSFPAQKLTDFYRVTDVNLREVNLTCQLERSQSTT